MAFNDGKPDDVAELIRKNVTYISVQEEEEENECFLSGILREDSNVAVAVIGCPGSDNFEVQFKYSQILMCIPKFCYFYIAR